MLPWKLLRRHILPVNQNLSSVYFSLAKFQLVSYNLSLAMIWQITYTHKQPKLCSATLNAYSQWLAFSFFLITILNFFMYFFKMSLQWTSWLAGLHFIHTPRRHSTNFHMGRLHSDVQSLTFNVNLPWNPFLTHPNSRSV